MELFIPINPKALKLPKPCSVFYEVNVGGQNYEVTGTPHNYEKCDLFVKVGITARQKPLGDKMPKS